MARNLTRRETLMAMGGGLGLAALVAGCATGCDQSGTGNGQGSSLNLTADAKDATDATSKANDSVRSELDFSNTSEHDCATRGLIAAPDQLEITDADGNVIWSQKALSFVEDADAPATANPSLWENTRNNHAYGLFTVVDGIYQVRGYDMSNLTLVEGRTGWIVFDTLMSVECSQAALALANDNLGERPVRAVIISHSHVDHYGGIKGLIDEDDAASASTPIEQQLAGDKIPIIVPPGFTEHVVSENLYAGPAMGRRASYQYGTYLEKGPQGSLAMGIGCGQSLGTTSFIRPSYEVPETGTRLTVDGVEMEFQLTPGTEAPAEMNTWIPSLKALWVAENCTGTLHNLYTLRGAQVRDGNAWANYIAEAVARYGSDAEVVFQSHNWPHWGNDVVNDYLVNSAAVYKFINDQALTYINEGYVGSEVASMVKLPSALAGNWYTRGYYGTVSHNARAVYQRYMGWYDANPVHLGELPPEDLAKKLVDYLGDVDEVLAHAKRDFDAGEYQWVAQITNVLVFADPSNTQARLLCADALEQLGYAAESGTWRNCYLTGAYELRNGTGAAEERASTHAMGTDTRTNLTAEMLWDFIGICLDKQAMADQDVKVNVSVTDTGQEFVLRFKNGPLLHFEGMQADDASVTLAGPRAGMLALLGDDVSTLRQYVRVSGDEGVLATIMGNIHPPAAIPAFKVVEP